MSESYCLNCEHPLAWHGDRAICACDGGHQGLGFHRSGSGGPKSLCACPGWAEPV